jgi:hypothetical protein|tara:strand:- start:12 stop:164 length:153 start_codon:yes stop_codon:yes gene_type:complete
MTKRELENELTKALNKIADEDRKKQKTALEKKNAKVIKLMNKIAKEEGIG